MLNPERVNISRHLFRVNLLPIGGDISMSHPLPLLEQVEFFLGPVFKSGPDKFPELGRDTENIKYFYIRH